MYFQCLTFEAKFVRKFEIMKIDELDTIAYKSNKRKKYVWPQNDLMWFISISARIIWDEVSSLLALIFFCLISNRKPSRFSNSYAFDAQCCALKQSAISFRINWNSLICNQQHPNFEWNETISKCIECKSNCEQS